MRDKRLLQAVCFLFFLMGGVARADAGYVYAFIKGGATPVVQSPQSLNSYNGGITVAYTSTGNWTVTFPNSGIGAGWGVVANAVFGGTLGVSCNVLGWGDSQVLVECFGPGSIPVNTDFTVLAVSNTNDKSIGFAWSGPVTPNPSIESGYVYNPSGQAITISRTAVGKYQLSFAGPTQAGGTVQVDGYNSADSCISNGWTSSSQIDVACTAASLPADSEFTLIVVPPGATPTGLGYTYANSDTASSYTPAAATTYNSTQNPVSITRNSIGNYLVVFPGMGSVPVVGGLAMVTADGAPAICQLVAWQASSQSFAFGAVVLCSDVNGNPIDTKFELLALPPMGYAYASVLSTGAVSAQTALNPGAAAVTAVSTETGAYTVTFPNSGIGPGWVVHANSTGTTWCQAKSWSNSQVQVICYTAGGIAANANFSVLALSNTNQQYMAFALANQPATSSYTASPASSYNPAGEISISRSSAGTYAVEFLGLAAGGGTVQISPYGTGTVTCYSSGWSGPNFSAGVKCVNSTGTATDTEFVVTIVPAGATPPGLMYAWANQDISPGYTPNPGFSYFPSGTLTVQRSSVGVYSPNFSANTATYGGVSLATPYVSTTRCAADSGNNTATNCFGLTGSPLDTDFNILLVTPTPNLPIVLQPISTSNSAVVYTSQGYMIAQAWDADRNGLAGLYMTFTAPTSGASGTFPGGATSVTAVTDSNGIAFSPLFTANGTPGTYSVTATTASYSPGNASPARISLTNLPLTQITLQTSPTGLDVSLAESNYTAPAIGFFNGGNTISIATQSPQAGATGIQYVWQSWSDNGAISHTVTVPSTATSYTANFTTQYQLTTSASPSAGGTVSPASGSFYNAGAQPVVNANPGAGYQFTSWSGLVANAQQASTTVIMNGPVAVTANFTATLISIAVTPALPSIPKGAAQQFTATGTYGDGTTQSITGSVTWISGFPAVATIASGGLATAVSVGTVTLTAVVGAVQGSTTLTVTSAALVSIAVTPATPSVAEGLTQQFTATGTYSDTTTQNITGSVTWSSGTVATATVSGTGLATAIAAGTSTIKATVGAVNGSTKLTVTSAALVSIAVTPANPSIAKGRTQQFTATGTYSDTTTQNITASVTWTSGTVATATVSGTGLATAIAVGASTIKATAGAVNGTTTLTVTPAALVSIAVKSANSSIVVLTVEQFQATGTYGDGSTQDITAQVAWSTQSPGAATITSSGQATGVAVGTSTITATSGSFISTETLTVTPLVPCTVNAGLFTVAEVQALINQALGVVPAVNDLNGDRVVSVLDIQLLIAAVLHAGCPS